MIYRVNWLPTCETEAMYRWISILGIAGWDPQAATDATSLLICMPDSQPFGGFFGGATNLGNDGAWVVMRSPDGERELLFYRYAGDTEWAVYYSRIDHFVGGTPAARPVATDEQLLIDTSNKSMFGAAANAYRFHCVANDAPPYNFWVGAHTRVGVVKAVMGCVYDFIVTGTQDAIDAELCVIYIAGNSANSGLGAPPDPFSRAQLQQTDVSLVAWNKCSWMQRVFGGGAGTYRRDLVIPDLAWNGTVLPGAAGDVLGQCADVPMLPPVLWGRATGGGKFHWKGQSATMRLVGQAAAAVGDVYTINGADERIVMGAYALPWKPGEAVQF